MKMNKIEEAIIEGTKVAQREYDAMTGWWLSHGPESYIMCIVANKIGKKADYSVFIEASPKKILSEREEKLRGRRPSNYGQRFDIVVWNKSRNDIRAIIEIKRAWSMANLSGDREKILKYMKSNKFVKAGYLLAYTEAKGLRRGDTLNNRLDHWAQGLNCRLVGSFIDEKGDGQWGWAVGLFRINT
jgi:hypothetical protein